MILLNGVPLGVAQSPEGLSLPVNLGELLFPPQTALPSDLGPPARPPYRLDTAPGLLTWPQGASRFALGQYIASDLEIRQIWPSGLNSDPVILTLATEAVGDPGDPLEFTVHPLYLIPLGLERSTQAKGLYLLLLVDGRYFFQTSAPDWTITEGTTTWDQLDTQLLSFLGTGATADSVAAAYLKPSASLAPPALASRGVMGWAGPLLDLICLSSGRRFVANRDGTFSLQNHSTAGTAEADSLNRCYRHLEDGGVVAFPPEREFTDGLYVVPEQIDCVYPEKDNTPQEIAPRSVVTTFSSVATAAGYAATDNPVVEDTLTVGMGLWGDGTNNAALDAHALQWSTDWYAWLRGKSLQTYAGIVDYTPSGFTDRITWQASADCVRTRVDRGMLNPRPNVPVGGYSGVSPLGPVFPYGAVFLGPVYFIDSTVNVINETWTFDATTVINFQNISIFTGPVYFPIYDYSASPLTINTVDWVIPAGNARIKIASSSEYLFLGGIIPGATPSGRLLYIYNVGDYTILLPNEYTAEATASRRILTTDENFYFLSPRECVCLCYDNDSQRWRVSENSHKRLSKVHTYTQWITDQEDVALLPDVELHRVSSNAEINWSGITNGLDSLRHRVINTGFFTIWILHNSSNSAADNRFYLPDSLVSLPLRPGQEVIFEYDLSGSTTGDGVWRPVCLYPDPPDPITFAVATEVCPTTNTGQEAAVETTSITSSTWVTLGGIDFTLTVDKAADFFFTGVFDCNGNGTAAVTYDMLTGGSVDSYDMRLLVDGSDPTGIYAVCNPAHPYARATVSQTWVISLAAGTHTIKLQGRRGAGTGSALSGTFTTLSWMANPVLTVEKREVSIPGGTLGPTDCTDDPDDCCGGSGSGGSGSGSGSAGGILTSCCPGVYIPQTLYATFSAGSGTCGCLDGITVALTYDAVGQVWKALASLCSGTTLVRFACATGGGFILNMTFQDMGGCTCANTPEDPGGSCSPVLATFTATLIDPGGGVTPCCLGTVVVDVTEVSP